MMHCKAIAPQFGVSAKTVREIWAGRAWTRATRTEWTSAEVATRASSFSLMMRADSSGGASITAGSGSSSDATGLPLPPNNDHSPPHSWGTSAHQHSRPAALNLAAPTSTPTLHAKQALHLIGGASLHALLAAAHAPQQPAAQNPGTITEGALPRAFGSGGARQQHMHPSSPLFAAFPPVSNAGWGTGMQPSTGGGTQLDLEAAIRSLQVQEIEAAIRSLQATLSQLHAQGQAAQQQQMLMQQHLNNQRAAGGLEPASTPALGGGASSQAPTAAAAAWLEQQQLHHQNPYLSLRPQSQRAIKLEISVAAMGGLQRVPLLQGQQPLMGISSTFAPCPPADLQQLSVNHQLSVSNLASVNLSRRPSALALGIPLSTNAHNTLGNLSALSGTDLQQLSASNFAGLP